MALHLYDWSRYEELYEVPFTVTQEGIAEAIGLHRGNVPRALKVLRHSNLIRERKAYVRGTRRKRKAYFLTPEGQDHTLAMRQNLEQSEIVVQDLDGDIKVAALASVPEYQKKATSLLDIVSILREGGSLDRRTIVEERGLGRTRSVHLKEMELDDVLRNLKESGSVRFVAVATRQGLLAAHRGSFHIDAALTAAATTALALSADKTSQKMGAGRVRQIIVASQEGNIVLRGVGERGILALLHGAVVGGGAQLGSYTKLDPGAVVGDGATVGQHAFLAVDVKIHPGRHVEESVLVPGGVV